MNQIYNYIFVCLIISFIFYKNNYIKLTQFPFYIEKKLNIDSSIIPLNIYQSWEHRNLSVNMINNINLLIQNNPEFNYYLYSDDDCRYFIKKNFDKSVLDAFDSLIPGAYKSDLWRYCVLYKNGGIYIDIKFCSTESLINLINKHTTYYVKDRKEYSCDNGVYNGFIISPANNPVLLNCINQIVKNVKNKYYGKTPLDPTGPCLFGYYINKLHNNNDIRLFFDGKNIIDKNNNIVLFQYPSYRFEQRKMTSKSHYSILWALNNIYK
jgi:mannosyltransferase OCH1-like enzyme